MNLRELEHVRSQYEPGSVAYNFLTRMINQMRSDERDRRRYQGDPMEFINERYHRYVNDLIENYQRRIAQARERYTPRIAEWYQDREKRLLAKQLQGVPGAQALVDRLLGRKLEWSGAERSFLLRNGIDPDSISPSTWNKRELQRYMRMDQEARQQGNTSGITINADDLLPFTGNVLDELRRIEEEEQGDGSSTTSTDDNDYLQEIMYWKGQQPPLFLTYLGN